MFAGSESTSAIKTYTNTIAVLLAIAQAPQSRDETASHVSRYVDSLETEADVMERILDFPTAEYTRHMPRGNKIFIIGEGTSLASAYQTALLFQETCHIPAILMSAGQIVHGPLELFEQNSTALIFDTGAEKEIDRVIADIVEGGGTALLVGARKPRTGHGRLHHLEIPASPPEFTPLLEIIPMELLANEIALREGLNPDVRTRTRE